MFDLVLKGPFEKAVGRSCEGNFGELDALGANKANLDLVGAELEFSLVNRRTELFKSLIGLVGIEGNIPVGVHLGVLK